MANGERDKEFIIGFSRSSKKFPVFSWLIRAYQGFTEYSHVYVKLKVVPRFPSNKILHAAEGQVSHYSETSFLKRNEIVEEFTIRVCEDTYMHLRNEIFHEKAGEMYSYAQNAGIALTRFMRFLGFKSFDNPWTEGWNCSEYAMTIIKLIYEGEFDHVDSNLVTPKELHDILCELKNAGRL